MADTKSIALSGNSLLDSLIDGGAWAGKTITYSFAAGDMNQNGVKDFDEGDWKAFYREILGNVESFTTLSFREVAEPGNINFRLFEGGGGESGVPGPGVTTIDTSVGIDSDVAGSAEAVRLGTYSLTWIHELGHALGLKHPHDVSLGPKMPGVVNPGDHGTAYLNSQLYSTLGYTSAFLGEDNPFTPEKDFETPVNAQPGSFGAIDIAVLQYLFGAKAHNTGNDIYGFSDDVDLNHGYTTIWDTGGTDAIVYRGESRSKIDLRAATLKVEIGGGGWISTSETLTGGYTIANGVTIENATGGNAVDVLIGNGVSNVLSGRGGNDALSGMDGDDRLDGGAGDDQIDGGKGADSAIYHGAFRTYSITRDGAATIVTGEGTDRLTTIETAVFTDGTYDVATGRFTSGTIPALRHFEGTDAGDLLRATDGGGWIVKGLGGNDVLFGHTGRDTLDGGSGNDSLTGGQGNDRLIGGTGSDAMTGASGNDVYVVDDTGDSVRELKDGGTDRVESSISYRLGSQVENLVLTGSRALSGIGNELANSMTGNAASNRLLGGIGNDALNGGGGADTLDGGRGLDVMTGGTGNDIFLFHAGDIGANPASADIVTDFSDGDRLDIGAIDAGLHFVGQDAFGKNEGEVRAYASRGNTFVEGDVDGDGTADFTIRLNGSHALSASDFVF